MYLSNRLCSAPDFFVVGAAKAVLERKSSLLAKGVTACKGEFADGAVTTLHAPDGTLIGRGIVAYDSATLSSILGKDSREIKQLHPDRSRCEVVHRDSLVLI